MKIKIYPSKISGIITAPASKSAMQRACALALIKNGKTYLNNYGKCNDDIAALDVIQRLGATITKIDDKNLLITSHYNRVAEPLLNCGESGLGLRMFTPLAALSAEEITISGTGSLLNRPIDFFDEVLPKLGIQIKSNKGKLPLTIKGPLIPKDINIDGSLSSQFLTGLLIAFADSCASPVTIIVDNLKSKPYIDLTLQMMDHFGLEVTHKDYQEFYFKPLLNPNIKDIHYSVEGDWSGGAFLLVAGAIAGEISISGLDLNSTQADRKIMEALYSCGAKIKEEKDHIKVGSADLKRFDFDATDCPDLFPPLVALASFCEGDTSIKGVSRLKHKESDRGATLYEEFTKLGVTVKFEGDHMIISGVHTVKSASVHSHHDHRIAMACAVAALRADGPIEISEAEAVNKSYPDFYDHLQTLKTRLEIF